MAWEGAVFQPFGPLGARALRWVVYSVVFHGASNLFALVVDSPTLWLWNAPRWAFFLSSNWAFSGSIILSLNRIACNNQDTWIIDFIPLVFFSLLLKNKTKHFFFF